MMLWPTNRFTVAASMSFAAGLFTGSLTRDGSQPALNHAFVQLGWESRGGLTSRNRVGSPKMLCDPVQSRASSTLLPVVWVVWRSLPAESSCTSHGNFEATPLG